MERGTRITVNAEGFLLEREKQREQRAAAAASKQRTVSEARRAAAAKSQGKGPSVASAVGALPPLLYTLRTMTLEFWMICRLLKNWLAMLLFGETYTTNMHHFLPNLRAPYSLSMRVRRCCVSRTHAHEH